MWLLALEWLRRTWPALVVCVAVAVLSYLLQCAYSKGKADCDRVWQSRVSEQQIERLRELRDTERRAQLRQDAITAQYTAELDMMRAEHELRLKEITDAQYEIINTFEPVCAGGTYADGVCRCQGTVSGGNSAGGVPAGTGGKSGAVCYSEDRLRRQIAESVAVGQECDREMTRFKALIDACKAR